MALDGTDWAILHIRWGVLEQEVSKAERALLYYFGGSYTEKSAFIRKTFAELRKNTGMENI